MPKSRRLERFPVGSASAHNAPSAFVSHVQDYLGMGLSPTPAFQKSPQRFLNGYAEQKRKRVEAEAAQKLNARMPVGVEPNNNWVPFGKGSPPDGVTIPAQSMAAEPTVNSPAKMDGASPTDLLIGSMMAPGGAQTEEPAEDVNAPDPIDPPKTFDDYNREIDQAYEDIEIMIRHVEKLIGERRLVSTKKTTHMRKA